MVKRISAAILLLPLAEIVVFVLVAALIGAAPALLLMLASTVAGLWVLRTAGRGGLARLRGMAADATAFEAGRGAVLDVLAGLLLFVPGFLTSLVGGLLLIGPVRRLCGVRISQWLARRQSASPGTVDLKPGEWTHVSDRRLDREPSSKTKPRDD